MTETVREFSLPDLGEGLTEAEIVRWLVAVGDRVETDQPVAEVETAKAVVEVPTPYGGVVVALFGAEGESRAVGEPLIAVAEYRTAAPDPSDAAGSGASGNTLVGYGTSATAPRRRRRVLPAPFPTSTSAAPAPAGAGPVPVVSPLVRRLARERGVDLRTLAGSGPGGLVLRADVTGSPQQSAPSSPAAGGGAGASAGAPARTGVAEAAGTVRIPLRGVRKAVADKLARSRREIPDATTWVDVDATRLLEVRRALASGDGEPVSFLALMARICVAALGEYPELNASVDGERQEIVRHDAVRLGFAAQSERGLVVPVVPDAHLMSLGELASALRRLTTSARNGTLTPSDLAPGTFTLNNYGVFGVDGSTPIINHPEAAMLGVGRVIPRPWVIDGAVEVRHVGQLSLTFDHRVCDGFAAGGFLRRVADLVEEPIGLLRLA
ncbi:dihydrolipoamide acetyltransferase family protein [Streptomyces yangpuensis]